MTDTEEDTPSYTSTSGGEAHYSSSDSGKQIVKKKSVPDKKPVLFHPGMLQDIMSEVSQHYVTKLYYLLYTLSLLLLVHIIETKVFTGKFLALG